MIITKIILIFLIIYTIVHFIYIKNEHLRVTKYDVPINNIEYLKKENVVFFMSSNYKTLPKYAQISKKMLEIYCKKHDYKFHYINHNNSNVSPYWLRVYDFINLTNIYPENTLIIYFDLDVVINLKMFDTSIEKIINDIDLLSNNKWDMYVSVDDHSVTSINTGVICIKNTIWIKHFLEKWVELYPKHKWKYDDKNGKWKCNENELNICKWAGKSYEQGSLKMMYQKNILNCKNKILLVDIDIFGDNKNINRNSFTIHMMDTQNEKREKLFSSFYNELIHLK